MSESKDVMSKNLITVNADDSILDAYIMMHEHGIRHLPVMSKTNKVVGILSDRDIQRAMVVNKVSNIEQKIELKAETKVEEFMSWPVYMVKENAPIKFVVSEMLSQKVSAFLVENKDGELTGIITTDDLLRLLLEKEVPESFASRILSDWGVWERMSAR